MAPHNVGSLVKSGRFQMATKLSEWLRWDFISAFSKPPLTPGGSQNREGNSLDLLVHISREIMLKPGRARDDIEDNGAARKYSPWQKSQVQNCCTLLAQYHIVRLWKMITSVNVQSQRRLETTRSPVRPGMRESGQGELPSSPFQTKQLRFHPFYNLEKRIF